MAQSLRPVVYVSENLHRNFANLVAPPIDGITNLLVHCKVGDTSSPLTDGGKSVQIDT